MFTLFELIGLHCICAFFNTEYRSEIADTLRLGTMLQPGASFAFVCQWVQNVLQKPVNTGQGNTLSVHYR